MIVILTHYWFQLIRRDRPVIPVTELVFLKIWNGRTVLNNIFSELYNIIESRKNTGDENSYTAYLFRQGLDKILKKCGEECSEVIIAAKNHDHPGTVCEISDLIYHLMVLMVNQGIGLEEVEKELEQRNQKLGNLKKFHITDKNT